MDFKSLLKLNIGDMVYEHYTNHQNSSFRTKGHSNIDFSLKIVGFFVYDSHNKKHYTSKSLDFVSNAIRASDTSTKGVILEVPEFILVERDYFSKTSSLGISFSYEFIETSLEPQTH